MAKATMTLDQAYSKALKLLKKPKLIHRLKDNQFMVCAQEGGGEFILGSGKSWDEALKEAATHRREMGRHFNPHD